MELRKRNFALEKMNLLKRSTRKYPMQKKFFLTVRLFMK